MRTVVISDLHGRDARSIYDEVIHTYEVYDKKGELQKLDNIVFLGDFMDNRNVNPDLQIKRLLDIFELKDKDSRIHLLVGNHDAKYIQFKNGEYKDKLSTKGQIEETVKIYQEHFGDFEYAFWDGHYTYSHTGITNAFIKAVGMEKGFDSPIEVCNHLNKMLWYKVWDELFYSIDGLKYRHCIKKDNPEYSQWDNLLTDYWKTNQVVGHYASKGKQIIHDNIFMIDDEDHGNYVLFES